MKVKGKKVQVQITFTSEGIKKSRELYLNISRTSKNTLDGAISNLEAPISKIELKKSTKLTMVRGVGTPP